MSDPELPSILRASQQEQPKQPQYNPIENSVTTDFDPDHKSYTRHFESSESARKALPKEYNNERIRSLAELSSTLSASSSLSGSTQHPHINDDDDEDDDDDADNIASNTDMNYSDDISSSSHSSTRGNIATAMLNSGSSSSAESTSLYDHQPTSNINDPTSNSNATSDSTPSTNMTSPTNQHHNNKQKNTSRFKHYHKPKVTESPRLVYLCQKFINERNIDGLALIARRRGLPPKLRQYAWPLLLASHPYVVNPSVDVEFPTQPLSKDLIPLKRIKNEIARYQKRMAMNHTTSRASTYNSSTPSVATNSTHNVTHQPPQQSARSTPISISPTGSSWSDASKINGSSDQQPIGENITSASLEAQKHEAIEEAIKSFLTKWGRIIPYDSGMVYMAFSLADWVDPVCRLEDRSGLLKGTTGSGTNTTESQASSPELGPADSHPPVEPPQTNHNPTPTPSAPYNYSSVSSSQVASPVSSGTATPTPESSTVTPFSLRSLSFTLPYVFSTVFEHLMLVAFHSPQSDSNNRPQGPCDSSTTDRISFFLSVIRRLLPDLAKHFDEEDVLSSIGGDEWLLWWVKWMGAKVWDRRDRARIWDMYFGWRPYPASAGFNLAEAAIAKAKKLAQETASGSTGNDGRLSSPSSHSVSSSSSLSSSASARSVPGPNGVPPYTVAEDEEGSIKLNNNVVLDLAQLEIDLGPDPFWSANISDYDDNEECNTATATNSTSTPTSTTTSINTITSNNRNTDTSTSVDFPPLPVPQIEPLLEHLFVCLVMLKSKTATLLELDQSEIRGCLGRLYRSKDIESIIVEAGECWRAWRHAEDLDTMSE